MNIANKKLYEQVKQDINKIYSKSSAYRSGAYIKEYKKRGGTFLEKKPSQIDKTPLARWFAEGWKSINNIKDGSEGYPTYRPTKRVTKKTPLTIDEIDKSNLKKQIELKQKIKGKSNLPPFKKK